MLGMIKEAKYGQDHKFWYKRWTFEDSFLTKRNEQIIHDKVKTYLLVPHVSTKLSNSEEKQERIEEKLEEKNNRRGTREGRGFQAQRKKKESHGILHCVRW